MKIGMPKEIHPGEKRVATTPEVAEKSFNSVFRSVLKVVPVSKRIFPMKLIKKWVVASENSANLMEECGYCNQGSTRISSELAIDETELLSKGGHLISFIWPAQNKDLMQNWWINKPLC